MFAAGKTAAVSGAGPDAQFNYVTMLLHGDGTNGAQNNTFLDSSTNNFTITRNGNTTQGSFSPYGSNWSNFFDGTGDYLSLASNAAFAFSSGDFTVEFWMQSDNASSGAADRIYRTGDNNATGNLQILISGTAIRIDSGVSTLLTGSVNVVNSSWHHIAVTRSGTSLKLFVDGTQDGSTVTNSTNFTTQVPQIAYDTAVGSGSEYTGYLSNLRVVKGTAVYTSNFTPSTTPLTAISGTSLLTCQSNRFVDNSTNNFTLTLNGTPSVQRFNPFGASTAYSTSVIGGSGYFDGSGDYLSTPNSSSFAFGTGNFTVEFWYRGTDTGGGFGLTTGGSTGYWQLNLSGSTMYWQNDVGVSNLLSVSASPILNNAWNHVAVVRNSTTLTIYFNGVSVTSTSDSSNYSGTGGDFQLGLDSNVDYITGYIADYRIVKGTAVYTGAFTPPTAPLTAITNTQLLLNYTNGAIFDNAMMNNLETLGNSQISTSVVKYGTGSLSFNGSNSYLTTIGNPLYAFGTGDFTIECWLNITSFNGGVVIDFRPASTNGDQLLVYLNGSTLELYASGDTRIASGTLTTATWFHFALSRSGSSMKMFINGTQAGSTYTASVNYTVGTKLGIGTSTYAIGSSILDGYIDDLRITKGYARYTANFTPPTQAFPNIGPV